jgi:hypothetical protein
VDADCFFPPRDGPLPSHCQSFTHPHTLSIQELQSAPGESHSNGIVQLGESGAGKQFGFVYFSNDIIVPGTAGALPRNIGNQRGHCVEVLKGKNLECYFTFNLRGRGRITAEAAFDLTHFPNAQLTITGGTGEFSGIYGHGCTSVIGQFDGTTFVYNFNYDLAHLVETTPSTQYDSVFTSYAFNGTLCDYTPKTQLPGFLSIQEKQSEVGVRHSNGIVHFGNQEADTFGFVYFNNRIVVPDTNETMGTQQGHCVEVQVGKFLECYFMFDIAGEGRITAEATFDLIEFPNAKLTITGGTGKFTGITGEGCTSYADDFNGTTFYYNFNYALPSFQLPTNYARNFTQGYQFPPSTGLPSHCQAWEHPYSFSIQELQSPVGDRHSNAIVQLVGGQGGAGEQFGFVYFNNDIVVPGSNKKLGTQQGHCVEVYKGNSLECYFNFNVKNKGRITAEASFDLTQFPNASLVITGGTGDFAGISGHGCTSVIGQFNGNTFVYNFNFELDQ